MSEHEYRGEPSREWLSGYKAGREASKTRNAWVARVRAHEVAVSGPLTVGHPLIHAESPARTTSRAASLPGRVTLTTRTSA